MYSDIERAILDEWVRRQTSKKNSGVSPLERYCPQDPTERQQAFLSLDCFEALFGGAASGGKSSCLLMAALQYVHVPGYAALIIRRTYADLSLPGAIMDRSHEWLSQTDASWNGSDKKWAFPSGAVLQFGYMESEKDKFRYQGSELQFIGVDEAGQVTPTQFLYLMSRIRRNIGVDVPLRMRAASNPGGVAHDFLKKRYVEGGEPGAMYVPSLVTDNPHVDQESYIKTLEKLDSTTKAQLLYGQWVRDDGGILYRYEDARNGVDAFPESDSMQYVLGIDLGAAQNRPTTSFVVSGFTYHDPDALWFVWSEKRADMIPSTIAERIQELDERYDFIGIVADAGALGKGYVEEFRRRYALPVKAAEKKDKLGYRKLMNGDFERGVIRAVRATCAGLIDEWQTIPWDEDGLDAEKGFELHESDAALYNWREAKHWLAKRPKIIPARDSPERAAYEEAQMKKRAIEASKKRLLGKRGRMRGTNVNILAD